MSAEKGFQLNLQRMMGRTDAVSVDNMFECLVYINNNIVSELLFIEQGYLASIFNDEDFLVKGKVNVCSVQVLVNRYEQAKKEHDDEFLSLLRIAHREARKFLDDVGVKDTVKAILEKRKAMMEYQAYMNILSSVINFMLDFGYNRDLNAIFSDVLLRLSAGVSQIEGISHFANAEGNSS